MANTESAAVAHSLLPWMKGTPAICVADASGAPIAVLVNIGGRDAESVRHADAEFIVRACNSHDELLDIARTVVALCDSGNVGYAQIACMETSPLVDAARAAIAKAEGRA